MPTASLVLSHHFDTITIRFTLIGSGNTSYDPIYGSNKFV